MKDLSDFFGQPFAVDSVESQTDFTIIPPGKYHVLVEKAEVQPTKAGNGHFIYLEMKILEGQFANQKVFDRINIDNPSEKCVEIGTRVLSALGKAVGLQAVSSVNELVNQTVLAHVKVKNERNEVRTYSAAGNSSMPADSTVSTTQPNQPAYCGVADKSTPSLPWKN